MSRILKMFENMRGLITKQVLTHTCGSKPVVFFGDITSITSRTCKLINHTRTKPVKDKVYFTPNMLPILKEEKTSLISKSLQ